MAAAIEAIVRYVQPMEARDELAVCALVALQPESDLRHEVEPGA